MSSPRMRHSTLPSLPSYAVSTPSRPPMTTSGVASPFKRAKRGVVNASRGLGTCQSTRFVAPETATTSPDTAGSPVNCKCRPIGRTRSTPVPNTMSGTPSPSRSARLGDDSVNSSPLTAGKSAANVGAGGRSAFRHAAERTTTAASRRQPADSVERSRRRRFCRRRDENDAARASPAVDRRGGNILEYVDLLDVIRCESGELVRDIALLDHHAIDDDQRLLVHDHRAGSADAERESAPPPDDLQPSNLAAQELLDALWPRAKILVRQRRH